METLEDRVRELERQVALLLAMLEARGAESRQPLRLAYSQ